MLITLTTDFGLDDSFVGIMKGVIARIAPQAGVIDLTHGIPSQDIMAGALSLRHSVAYFPPGTIHVAVIDPGVGTKRRSLLIESKDAYFIGPDNGVLSLAVGESPNLVIELANPKYKLQPTSGTFHGRDIFAPAAAHLSRGVLPAAFGENLGSFTKLKPPKVIRTQNSLNGAVIYIDKFGNLFTNIEQRDLTGFAGQTLNIVLGDLTIRGIAQNYAGATAGGIVAVVNSWGLLEIAANQGNAANRTGAKVGDNVNIIFRTDRSGGQS
jgi:S-adenosyl-L-methionine hydrolase (adenosine-forming)